MQLHELQTKHKRATKRRIGRGGKRGTTSGRGQKGQKSRAGHKIRPAFRDLLIRVPKLRGFGNKPKSDKPKVFNLDTLSKMQSATISLETLKNEGLVGKKYNGPVKVLGKGEVTKALDVRGFDVSVSARVKIEKAGGNIK